MSYRSHVFLVLIFIALIYVWLFFLKALKDKIESGIERTVRTQLETQLKMRIESRVIESRVVEKQVNIIYSSFTDLFSGTGWIDVEKTAAYQDFNAAAFTFPPVVSRLPGSPVSQYSSIQVSQFLNFPVFNPISFFSPELRQKIKDASLIGAGGTANDFLALYGDKEGIAIRVKKGKVTDISQFFNHRVMSGGFKPIIFRAPDVWYIQSVGELPKLLKLFENGTGEIRGILDLTEKVRPTEPLALEQLRQIDRGFDKSRILEVVSKDLNTYSDTKVISAAISELDFGEDGGLVKFYLSNNGIDWSQAFLGQEINFSTEGGNLFWRAEFIPDGNQFSSPFLSRIYISFKAAPL